MPRALAMLIAALASPAAAEVTAEEACAYFAAEHLRAESATVTMNDTRFGPAVLGEVELERYRIVAFGDVRSALVPRAAPERGVTSFLSAAVVCEVDLTDRRVLSIRIGHGARVGERQEDARGLLRATIGPSAVDIATRETPKAGRY